MERWQKSAIAAMLAMILALAAFGLGYGAAGGDGFRIFGGGGTGGSDVIADAYDKILEDSVDPPSEKVLTRGAIRGMIRALRDGQDPYANFYDPRGYRDAQEVIRGNFSGIGVSLSVETKELRIVGVLPDSPAEKKGLRKGDVIVKVEGQKVTSRNKERTVERIKGRPGTQVSITVRRKNRTFELTLTRAELELPNVSARMTKTGNAYLRVFGFAKGAAGQARAELEELVDEGARGVILDLRDNPGGLFVEAINLSSLFIEEGEVVIYRRNDGTETAHEAKGDAFEDIPLVVLVNGGSASASEIVAGALQDHDRAQLVGTQTFGKAAVQEFEELLDDSAVKLTVASYLTPDGRDITGEGIHPDIVVSDPSAQEKRARELLENEVASAGEQG